MHASRLLIADLLQKHVLHTRWHPAFQVSFNRAMRLHTHSLLHHLIALHTVNLHQALLSDERPDHAVA